MILRNGFYRKLAFPYIAMAILALLYIEDVKCKDANRSLLHYAEKSAIFEDINDSLNTSFISTSLFNKSSFLNFLNSYSDEISINKNLVSEDSMSRTGRAENGGLPGNSIGNFFSGIFSAIGNGFQLANNLIQEGNKRQKLILDVSSAVADVVSSTSTSSQFVRLSSSRVNNRGPSHFTNSPFEAIPLELALESSSSSVPPKQLFSSFRPPNSHIPSPSKAVYVTGVPLPELLVPPVGLSEETNDYQYDELNFKKLEHSFVPSVSMSHSNIDSLKIEFTNTLALNTIYSVSSNLQNKAEKLSPTSIIDVRPVSGAIVPLIISTPPLSFTSTPSIERPSIFDITVTANQNYNGKISKHGGIGSIITKPRPGDRFVSIDGKRTYFDIIGHPTSKLEHVSKNILSIKPQPNSSLKPSFISVTGIDHDVTSIGLASVIPTTNTLTTDKVEGSWNFYELGVNSQSVVKHVPRRIISVPAVRIDTCVVGDDSTCEKEKFEVCKFHLGISSCFCKPGFGRKKHGSSCQKIVRLIMALQVDRMNLGKIFWNSNFKNSNSDDYRLLENEAIFAIDTAMSSTPLASWYVSNSVNQLFPMNGKVTINATLILLSNAKTRSVKIKKEIQRNLNRIIKARGGNIGKGNLYVDGPLNPIPRVADANECADALHDCSPHSFCINTFGGFTCRCRDGYADRFDATDLSRSGRYCQSCSADFCSGHGFCSIQGEPPYQHKCQCTGNYFGEKCELDGEVIGVAIGASISAIIIILLTLFCLCLWSRRWRRNQLKAEMACRFGTLAPSVYPPNLKYHEPPPTPPMLPPPRIDYSVEGMQINGWSPTSEMEQSIYAQMRHGLSSGGDVNNLYSEPIYHPPISASFLHGNNLQISSHEANRCLEPLGGTTRFKTNCQNFMTDPSPRHLWMQNQQNDRVNLAITPAKYKK